MQGVLTPHKARARLFASLRPHPCEKIRRVNPTMDKRTGEYLVNHGVKVDLRQGRDDCGGCGAVMGGIVVSGMSALAR